MNDLSQRPLQLMLIDEDPVFRLGLKVWLEQQSDFAVVAEAGGAKEALDGVRSRFADYQKSLDDPALRKKKEFLQPPIDLVILDLGLGAKDPDATPGLAVCQQITADFPQLPVLVLSTQLEPVLQAAAERMGASAYGTRSMSVRRLAQLIRQTAVQSDTETKASAAPKDPTTQNTQSQASSPSQPDRRSPAGQGSRARSNALSRLDDIPGPLTAMRISMRLSGMRQIDQNMVDVEVARQQATSWLSQVVLDGKKRELAAAKWLMSALWRTPRFESNR
ncbi:MAG: response regulator transcription factor, partial [Cyanobacteria bacterium J06555_13]